MPGTPRALLLAAFACAALAMGDLVDLVEVADAEPPFGTDGRLLGLALAALAAAVACLPRLPLLPRLPVVLAAPAARPPLPAAARRSVRLLRVRAPPR